MKYLKLKIANKNKTVYHLTIDEKIPSTLIGDPTKLSQIFINLINNAIKYAPASDITVRAQLLNDSKVKITIKDNGPGIAKENQEKIISEAKKSQFPFDDKKINSDNYLKFIVKELKPYIDKKYSVYKDAKHTGIMGSSMGGLISMYAICEYPKVFGKAACLSTHWVGFRDFENSPIPESFFAYMEKHLPNPKDHKIYFDYGTETLDASYLKYEYRVDEVLQSKGWSFPIAPKY